MAKNNECEAQQGGFFGRIFGNKGKSPIKAKMGEQNAYVFNAELKRWVLPGEKIKESTLPSAPPPMSRAASAASMSESEGPDGHRRTGSTDSSKRSGAAARYANPGLLATSRAGSEQSVSAASIMPSTAKPPLVPSAKPSVFLPGKAEGTAASSGPRFFVPGGASTSQGASSRFAGFSSKVKQAPVEEATEEQPAPEETLLSPSKRAKTSGSGQQGAAESMESEVTLAKGVGAQAPETLPFGQATLLDDNVHQAAPVPLASSAAAEESVGENTFASDLGTSDSAITSPGPNEAIWGRGSGNVLGQGAAAADIDPEGGQRGDFNQSVLYGGDFNLGRGEGSFTQPPDQLQDYFGADTAAAAQLDGGSAPETADAASEGDNAAAQASWEEVQQWADYYRQEGYSEEDVHAWIASNYPHFAQQVASQDPYQEPQAAYNTVGSSAAQQELPSSERPHSGGEAAPGDPMAVEQQATPFDADTGGAAGQPQGSFQGEAEGAQQEAAYQDRKRLQSEAYSDVADWGSSRGHLDDVTSVATGGPGEAQQSQPQARGGRLASESSASGKLSGPLPWDGLDEHSDEENSTAGTPRFELAFSNGEVGNSARPALAGAAFAEAAEQAGSKLTGWVTGLVRSGVQSQLAANARFPRAPLDIRNAPSSPSASIRSGTTSIRAQQGTPTSVKSVEGQHGDSNSLPPSAKAARYGRGAFDNESVLSETIVEEDAEHGSHGCRQNHSEPPGDAPDAAAAQHFTAAPQGQDAPADGWAGGDLGNHAPKQDGWDFDASALDDLPPENQAPAPSEEQIRSAAEAASFEGAAVENTQVHDSMGRLPRTWAGDVQQQPDAAAQADVGFDRSAPIPTAASGTALPGLGTNGGSVMGESPPAGWEGESELGFPLDDVPKDVAQRSGQDTSIDLPEAAALTPLKVPPLRAVFGGVTSARPTSAAAAAVKEAFAHGDEAAQLAALQERLEEVIALHQHACDEAETLRDQNGALELELADLKTQLDADVAEARLAQDALAAKAGLEEQLEELWQEAEQLRVKNDALKADNATLLAEQAADGAAAAHSNGDLKPRAAGEATDVPSATAAAELAAARQRIAELEAQLEQEGSGAAEVSELEAQITELMAESEALAEEALAKDEEIEGLEGRLAAANQALATGQQGGSEELKKLRREAAAANAEIVSLGDALDAMSQDAARLNESMAARDAELERLRAELVSKADDAQLLDDLQSQVVARETEIARLQGELSSKADELARISKEAAAKEAAEKKLRSALKHAREAAAKERAELQAAQQAADNAQAEARRLTEDLSQLQEGKSSAEQRCQKAEAEVKTLQENQALDFERIGLLSDENAALQEKLDELEATAGGAGPLAEEAAEVARLRNELAAAAARAGEAEGRAKMLAQEKESFGKRGQKLQAKLNRLQAEFQEKQAQAAKDLEAAREEAAAAVKQAADAEAARAALAEAVQQEKAQAAQGEQGLMAEASALAAQVAELQAAVGAEGQRRQEAEEQLARAAQEAAAAKHALSEELAAEKVKVAELEEEASALFDKVSAAEEEAGVAEARAHSLADQLKTAQTSLQAAGEPQDSGAAEAEEDLAQARAEAAEQEREFGDLLACLGQESAKVAALQQLLAQRGIDPSGVLAQVEADYGFGDDVGGDEEEGELEAEQQPEAPAPIGTDDSDPFEQAGPSAAEGAPADQEWPGFAADAAQGGMPQQEPSSAAQHAKQASMEGLPEGELLSPDKNLPRLNEGVKSEITAGINFGGAQLSGGDPAATGQEIDFDGWGADVDGDWGFN